MPAWITESIGSIIVSAVLLTVIIAIIALKIKDKKKGKKSCGCGCSSCAMKDVCHSEKK